MDEFEKNEAEVTASSDKTDIPAETAAAEENVPEAAASEAAATEVAAPETAVTETAVPEAETDKSSNNADAGSDTASPIQKEGGIFAEQSFAANENTMQQGMWQNGYPTYYPYSAPAYRNVYGGQVPPMYPQYNGQMPHQNVQGYPMPQQNIPSYGAVPPYGAVPNSGSIPPYVPQNNGVKTGEIPAVPEKSGDPAPKKSGTAAVIIIFVIIALFIGIIILLAFFHSDDKGSGEKTGTSVSDSAEKSSADKKDKVTVEITVQQKPSSDDNDYADKEKGLYTTTGVVKAAMPSVVNVYAYGETSLTASKSASGIIFSEDGYILTNAHVVTDIKRVKIRFSDDEKTEVEADIIGYDEKTDIAVLKLKSTDGLDITPAVFGDTAELLQGEQVIAIGNAGGFNNTVTVGHISHADRKIDSYTGYPVKCIQTDAALNNGDSGGAIVNMYGQVVGMITSKYTSSNAESLGFAIASDYFVEVAEDIIEKGYVSGRARMGINYKLITADVARELGVKPGALVADIDKSCDVANTKLQIDDIITAVDGKPLYTTDDVVAIQYDYKPGDKVTASVYRKSLTGEVSEFEIEFELDEFKE